MGTFIDMRPHHDAVEIVVNSAVDEESSRQVMQEAISFMASIGLWRSLCDFTEARQIATATDAISMADALAANTPPEWRQAILPPRDLSSRMAMDAWEAACNNRNRGVKIFRDYDREAALAWLLEGDEV